MKKDCTDRNGENYIMPSNYKIRIAVCDDERKACIEISSMAKKILQEENIPYSISVYENASGLLKDIQNGVYDLQIFLFK